MIARMLTGLAIGLAFELLDHEPHDVWIIDLFAIAIHDPPAALDLEGEAAQRALVCDLGVMAFVRDAERRVPPLVVSNVDDVLYRRINPQPLDGSWIRLVRLSGVH